MDPSASSGLTLSVDCGGSGIKAGVLDASGTAHAPPVRVPTPYPLPPEHLVATVAEIAQTLPRAERLSLGLPGMIRHGVVISTPHYVNRAGPRTRPVPALVASWTGHDLRASLEAALGMPAIVVNDAELHGAGVIAGAGLELVLTLGTGLGSAHYDGGRLAPHLELSHAPVRRGTTYDAYIGEPERRRLGDAMWSRRVLRVVEGFGPVFRWDRLYLGGGNSDRITQQVRERLGPEVVVVPNSAALVGGVRAWALWGSESA